MNKKFSMNHESGKIFYKKEEKKIWKWKMDGLKKYREKLLLWGKSWKF